MNYVKKMCILRQARQGFSGDGKALSGLIKIEQYGKNLSIEVSVINFAPLISGEYYCLISDGKGKTEMLSLRGKSLFNILSDLDISRGFCGVICYVKNDVVPVAYGINGNGSYDWKTILNSALPPVFPNSKKSEKIEKMETAETAAAETNAVKTTETIENEPTMYAFSEKNPSAYNDETVATENYYQEKEKEDERELFSETRGNARAESQAENEREEAGADASENVDAHDLRHPFETDGDGYYRAVKGEIDELFEKYPRDQTLVGAFSCSEWVRVKGEENAPEYLVGVIYDDGKAKYICYALFAEDKDTPPEEIKDACTFVPVSAFSNDKGFFVIFQSATTGECIKPQKV